MHLLRSLVFIEAHYQCYLHPTYTHTIANHLADDLSVSISLLFYPSFPKLTHSPPQHLSNSWTFSWTLQQIGLHYIGTNCSILLQEGLSGIYSEYPTKEKSTFCTLSHNGLIVACKLVILRISHH